MMNFNIIKEHIKPEKKIYKLTNHYILHTEPSDHQGYTAFHIYSICHNNQTMSKCEIWKLVTTSYYFKTIQI